MTYISTALTAIHSFLRATAGDVPEPSSVSITKVEFGGPAVSLMFDSLDDLRNWAAYLQVPATRHDVRPQYNRIHHRFAATWGPYDGQMVRFEGCFLEDLPAHSCTVECDPGNCEVEHHAAFGLPADCESVEF